MEITYSTLKSAIDEVVEEYGEDYVYPRLGGLGHCVYINPDGSPSCLLGHALIRLGVMYETLSSNNNKHVGSIPLLPWDSDVTRQWARRVQAAQDRGTTWGEAASEEL